MDIRTGLAKGNKRALARLISLVENEDGEAADILKSRYKDTGRARIIGITGPPGAGKSTLTDKLIKHLREQDQKIAVIAVDPTSPCSGGAILGDRIRMNDRSTDPDVFIRSMGTRGALGGLSNAVNGAVIAMDIFGFDYIFIETVGVGQSEVDIIKIADTVVMVMVPGLGDDIQAIKAGIMEVGDIFVVNKADRDGSDRTVTEIRTVLESGTHSDYVPPVLKTIAEESVGIPALFTAIESHREYMESSGNHIISEKRRIEQKLIDIFHGNVLHNIRKLDSETHLIKSLVEDVYRKSIDPYTAAEQLLEQSFSSELR
jgi:LAO/AO transport system kinase